MSTLPDETNQSIEQQTLPAQRSTTAVAERKRDRQRLISAQDFLRKATLEDEFVRRRYRHGLRVGDLPPVIEKALLDIAWGGQTLDKRLAAALGDTTRGLTLLLRKALDVDPLATAKQVGAGTTIEQPPQETPDLRPRSSIVPPARPSKRQQGKATLRPGEEELT